MTTFSGQFLGCKVSQTDLDALRERLAAAGLEERDGLGDVHVVNGCCVTGEALAKTRQAVRRAQRAGARVLVTGCAARLADPSLAALGDGVHVLRAASEDAPAAAVSLLDGLGCLGGAPRRAVPGERVRAFLKVQDGCSFACAFCVIPAVRGATRSRPLDAILREAERRLGQGFGELVLSGVNIGLYRADDPSAAGRRLGLAEVIRAVGATPGLERLRLSSIEPDHLDEHVLDALREHALPHLHVPLQSGSDDVLAGMRRRYRAERYLRRIARARDVLGDGLNVTADVMVGFPGETEEDFAATLRVAAQAGLGGVHVFPYSPRPGTRTADDDPVPPEVKRERSERLRAAVEAAAARRRAAAVGREDAVLVERVDADGSAEGYGRDYTRWRLAAPGAAPGAIVPALATGVGDGCLEGRAVAHSAP